MNRELRQAKTQLQNQLKGMVQAEQEMTEHLKTTHSQIDEQLQLLRTQLKVCWVCCTMLYAFASATNHFSQSNQQLPCPHGLLHDSRP